MNIEQLVKVAKGYRHKHYKKHVELADMYETFVTGEGLDDMLKQYAKREDAELFQQRKEITQHVITAVTENIMQPFEKVPRSKYQRTVAYAKGEQNASILEGVLSKFYDNDSLENYLSERLIALNAIDPNAFIVVEIPAEFDARTGQRVQPYPFEVYSSMCLDYHYQQNTLQYLIVLTDFYLNEENKNAKKYTMYLPDRVIVLQETDSNLSPSIEPIITTSGLRKIVNIDNKVFEIIEPTPYNLGAVPAMRAGYKRQRSKNTHTFIAPYHAAIPYLKKTLKINSELDLSMSNSAFPFSIRYALPCPAVGCNRGVMHDGKECGTCKGTGTKQRPTSAMEEITVALPNRAEDIIDLDKLLVFKAPPIEVLKFQDEYIDKITEKAKQIVFNADIFSREQIAQTATSKNIQTENLYDVLYPFARKFSMSWEFLTLTIAKYTDLSNGLVASMYFAKDLKMKTSGELLIDLKSANDTGAGNEVRRTIQQDIMRNIYAEDNYQYVRYVTKEEYNPFSGMNNSEIIMALGSDFTTLYNKVLYTNLGNIFDDLERESIANGIDFYKIEKIKQRELIKEKVNLIIADIKENAPKTNAFLV